VNNGKAPLPDHRVDVALEEAVRESLTPGIYSPKTPKAAGSGQGGPRPPPTPKQLRLAEPGAPGGDNEPRAESEELNPIPGEVEEEIPGKVEVTVEEKNPATVDSKKNGVEEENHQARNPEDQDQDQSESETEDALREDQTEKEETKNE
jgi:hypothetical protein